MDYSFPIQMPSPEFLSKNIKMITNDKLIRLLLENNWVTALFILKFIAGDRCSKNIHYSFIYIESLYDNKMYLSTASCHWGIFSQRTLKNHYISHCSFP